MDSVAKKVYSAPKLTVHGSVEEITQECTNKDFGSSDGWTFQGTPITWECGS
jgi:hypothetical protein